jgi:hypothetical protein
MRDVFLFAHQDDEFGVFHALERSVAAGRQPFCLYLTNGDFGGQDVAVRNRESQAVLASLGVRAEDCLFVGQEEGISDGALSGSLGKAYRSVARRLANVRIDTLYLLAYEGGHQDHDATHVIGCRLAGRLQPRRMRQFPLYHGKGLPGPLFRVLAPIRENGNMFSENISWRRRFAYIAACLHYRSQWKTWLGLFPFVALKLIFSGRQHLQGVDARRCRARPHAGALLYERRGFMHYEDFHAQVEDFLSSPD